MRKIIDKRENRIMLKKISIKDAIAESGLSRQTIINAINKGQIKAEIVKKDEFFDKGRPTYQLEEQSFRAWLTTRKTSSQVKMLSVEVPIYLIEYLDRYSKLNDLTKREIVIDVIHQFAMKNPVK